ncbi:MAG: hypothetical protein U1F77_09315 [Kiritimatiellia bacterium]
MDRATPGRSVQHHRVSGVHALLQQASRQPAGPSIQFEEGERGVPGFHGGLVRHRGAGQGVQQGGQGRRQGLQEGMLPA